MSGPAATSDSEPRISILTLMDEDGSLDEISRMKRGSMSLPRSPSGAEKLYWLPRRQSPAASH